MYIILCDIIVSLQYKAYIQFWKKDFLMRETPTNINLDKIATFIDSQVRLMHLVCTLRSSKIARKLYSLTITRNVRKVSYYGKKLLGEFRYLSKVITSRQAVIKQFHFPSSYQFHSTLTINN